MVYNDRVTLITFETVPGILGEDKKEIKYEVPCSRGRLTNNEQIGMFGEYRLSAFKLHIQGIHKNVEELIYKGQKRSIKGIIYHHNKTVVVVL